MPYVPGFEYDLFVSYASDDNKAGAVTDFVETLERCISDNLVNYFSPKEKIRVYFDRKRLATQTAGNWDAHEKAASSAILVPLLSPNYLSSRYCSDELTAFTTQPHVADGCPYALVSWMPFEGSTAPAEYRLAQRHPAGNAWLGSLPVEQRKKSAEDFALKLRDSLIEMRASLSAVFLGPAAGRGLATRARLRDELEKSGHRIVPEADFVYDDESAVRELLKKVLLAIHFPGDSIGNAGLMVMEDSFRLPARKTMLIRPLSSELSPDEADVLAQFAGEKHSRLEDKTDDQVWEVVKQAVRAARFQNDNREFAVGVACHEIDLAGAKELAEVLRQANVSALCPAFDAAVSTTDRIKAFKATIAHSKALLCYWARADEKRLEERLRPAFLRRYKPRAWYLAPPFDVPGKDRLSQSTDMVLRQKALTADLESLGPFLRELGWESQK